MCQGDAVELVEDEFGGVFGREFRDDDGVCNAGFDVFVDGEREFREQGGLCDEDEVVVLGEIFEEETETP